jgi:hypothetical protein
VNLDLVSTQQSEPGLSVRPGDYLATQRDLYCVERVEDGSAIVEDCRSGALIEIELENLLALRRVEPAAEPR